MMKQITLLAIAVLTLVACSKKNEATNPVNNQPASNLNDMEKMLVGNWIVESKYRRTPASTTDTTSTYLDLMDPCEKDNVFTFRADKRYTLDEGTDTCYFNRYQYANNHPAEWDWEINADSNFVFGHGPSFQAGPGIDEISEHRLVISTTIVGLFPPHSTEVHVYRKK